MRDKDEDERDEARIEGGNVTEVKNTCPLCLKDNPLRHTRSSICVLCILRPVLCFVMCLVLVTFGLHR